MAGKSQHSNINRLCCVEPLAQIKGMYKDPASHETSYNTIQRSAFSRKQLQRSGELTEMPGIDLDVGR